MACMPPQPAKSARKGNSAAAAGKARKSSPPRAPAKANGRKAGAAAETFGPPTFRMEAEALAAGQGPVAGIDEAGRGPLAGPVVVAAVVLDPNRIPEGLDDSKKLTAQRRAELADLIFACAEVSIVTASRERIDRDNIRNATLWAMSRAVAALPCRPGLALVDGCDTPPRIGCTTRCVVKGDATVLSIAAASIVAKVTRDRLMIALGESCPGYGLEKHMGYSTAEHIEAVARLGPSPHHRRSFWRIAAAFSVQGVLDFDGAG